MWGILLELIRKQFKIGINWKSRQSDFSVVGNGKSNVLFDITMTWEFEKQFSVRHASIKYPSKFLDTEYFLFTSQAEVMCL